MDTAVNVIAYLIWFVSVAGATFDLLYTAMFWITFNGDGWKHRPIKPHVYVAILALMSGEAVWVVLSMAWFVHHWRW